MEKSVFYSEWEFILDTKNRMTLSKLKIQAKVFFKGSCPLFNIGKEMREQINMFSIFFLTNINFGS